MEVLADKYNQGDLEGLVKKRDASVPMGWQGGGWDTASVALWLGSESSRYITGQEVSGSFYCCCLSTVTDEYADYG